MKKRLLWRMLALTLACAMVLPLTACGGVGKGIHEDNGVALQSKNLTTDITKTLEQDKDDMELIDFNHEITMDFAVRLVQNCMKPGENMLVSPVSVLAALAMTANGARGETLEQMETVFGSSIEDLNREIGSYITNADGGDKYKINIANAIWFKDDESFTVNQDFLQVNVDHYEAEVYEAPFDETTVDDINNWVKYETDGMIEKLLKEMSPNAVMYLVNAVAFDAEWQEKYSEKDVRKQEFTKEDGTKQNVEFMFSEEGTYIESEQATGFMKYYKGNEYAFVAILPNEGISVEDYIANLDGESLYQTVASTTETIVYTSIPKFEHEYDVELADVLSTMGMPMAFDGAAADFSGIGVSTMGNLCISRVMHKTYISVDENGTKAAAATGVEVSAESEPANVKWVYLNRPFVYMILDTSTCKPLFIGTVMSVEE